MTIMLIVGRIARPLLAEELLIRQKRQDNRISPNFSTISCITSKSEKLIKQQALMLLSQKKLILEQISAADYVKHHPGVYNATVRGGSFYTLTKH